MKDATASDPGVGDMYFYEFVGFIAACLALNALAIDIMLPALPDLRVSVAIDVTGTNAEAGETVWVSVLAFGRTAEELAWAHKGETVTAQGRLTRGRCLGDGVGDRRRPLADTRALPPRGPQSLGQPTFAP